MQPTSGFLLVLVSMQNFFILTCMQVEDSRRLCWLQVCAFFYSVKWKSQFEPAQKCPATNFLFGFGLMVGVLHREEKIPHNGESIGCYFLQLACSSSCNAITTSCHASERLVLSFPKHAKRYNPPSIHCAHVSLQNIHRIPSIYVCCTSRYSKKKYRTCNDSFSTN